MPIVLPTPHLRLTTTEAGAIAQRARQLLRKRRLTPHQYALLDALLWQARKPGEATLIASGKALARLSGQARSTVTNGVRVLVQLGLVQRIRRRVRLVWVAGATASRVAANGYRLLKADTETGNRPADPRIQIFILEPSHGDHVDAQAALARRRAWSQEELLRKMTARAGQRSALAGA